MTGFSSYKTLRRVLFRHRKPLYQIAALITGILGGAILLMSLQIHLGIGRVFRGQGDIARPEILVLRKPASTLFPSAANITQKDISLIGRLPGVTGVSPFLRNTFPVSARIDFGVIFQTEMFLEAIPDQFLDVAPEAWGWHEGDPSVPLILPADFLTLYNMSFAPSRGLRPITPAIAGSVPFELIIGDRVFRGRIAGWSDRLPTILAPVPFMKWADKTFGRGDKSPKKLAVEVKNPADPGFRNNVGQMGFTITSDRLVTGKIRAFSELALAVAGGLGLVLVGLALFVFILSLRVMLEKSRDDLTRLADIGVSPGTCLRVLMIDQIPVVIISQLSAAVIAWYTGLAFSRVLSGIGVEGVDLTPVWLILVPLVVTLLLSSALYLTGKQQIRYR